jgi:replicative DNA helicase
MEGGEVLVVSGKTGEGKTTMAKQIARHVWQKYGFVLYVSLEMPEHQDVDKDMARITGEYVLKIQRGHYSEEMYGKLVSGTGDLSKERVACYYPIRGTLANIYAVARRVQAQVGLKFMVLDYIQLLENARGGAMLEERIANISRNLKYMARDLNIPVMALSRMTRDSNADDINRLYGSGSLEYDADWVMFMKADVENNKGTLTIAKHRQGGVRGKFELGYNWQKQDYYEITDREESE